MNNDIHNNKCTFFLSLVKLLYMMVDNLKSFLNKVKISGF